MPIAIIIILVLPPIFDKYQTRQVYKKYEYGSKVYYHDLNNDSFSEYIRLHYAGNKTPSDNIYNAPAIQIDTACLAEKLPVTIGQFNFTKPWFQIQKLYFGDFDNDGFKEIYFYTYSNDSLFLNGLDVFNRKGFFLEKYICSFNFYNELPDIIFGRIIIGNDLNGDGSEEVIGSVIGCYTALPRFVYSYDIVNDTLIKSKSACINFYPGSILQDSRGDVYMSGSNYAPGNVKDSMVSKIEFTDHSSWLIVLNKELDFVFPPIENPGFTSSVNSYLKKENDEIFIYAFFKPSRGRSPHILKKYNLHGDEVTSINFIGPVQRSLYKKMENNNEVLYIYEMQDNIFYRIDEDLNFKKEYNVNYPHSKFVDLDFDGSEEIFNWQEGGDFAYLYTSGFTHPAKVGLKDLVAGFIISPCRFKDNSANFVIHSGDFVYYFKYFRNPVYYLKFPFYLGIYLVISFLFFIVMYFQKKALNKKFEQDKKVTELELLTIKNQIDPYFIINAINSLGAVIFKSNEDKKQSYQYLINLTSLIRDTLQNSQKISISLSEEIDFVQNYLQLQKYRYRDSFDFKINNQVKDPEEAEIPKMIIQTFAENAVKHGLAHKTEGDGKIVVAVTEENGSLQIIVEDNGIGRKKASIVSKGSTGKGMEIIDQIIEMYNRLKKTSVSFEVIDLYDDGPVGTRVVVEVPLQ